MIIKDLPASRTAPLAMNSAAIWQSLPRSEPILYGDDRTARTLVDGLAQCPVPGDRGEKSLKSGPPACFGALMGGIGAGSGPVCPGGEELLMPQPILRYIARRAMQVAIAAAGILVVLLVFSRQAHAATSAPSATPTPSASLAPAAPAPVASAAAPVTSPASAAAPAPSAPSAPVPSAHS